MENNSIIKFDLKKKIGETLEQILLLWMVEADFMVSTSRQISDVQTGTSTFF